MIDVPDVQDGNMSVWSNSALQGKATKRLFNHVQDINTSDLLMKRDQPVFEAEVKQRKVSQKRASFDRRVCGVCLSV